MWFFSQGVVALTLALAFLKVLVNPNRVSKVAGDKIKEDEFLGKAKDFPVTPTTILVHFVAALVCWGQQGFEVWSDWTTKDLCLAGLCAAGILLRYSGICTLGHLYTFQVSIRKDHRLMQVGPYKWVRHPGYSGYMVGTTALALLTLPLGLALCHASWIIAIHVYRIPMEEKLLHAHFGREWDEYAARTKRFVPFIF